MTEQWRVAALDAEGVLNTRNRVGRRTAIALDSIAMVIDVSNEYPDLVNIVLTGGIPSGVDVVGDFDTIVGAMQARAGR